MRGVATRAARSAARVSSVIIPGRPSMRISVCGNGGRGQYRWKCGEMWDCGSGIPKGVRVDHWVGSRGSNGVDSLLCEGPGGYARGVEVMV